MADVYYPGIAAGDAAAVTETGVVSAIVTPNATYQVFELTDSAYSTPLTIKTPSGLERTDVPVGDLPIFPDVYVVSPNYAHNWKSGDLVFRRDSQDAKDQAVADALAAVQDAAINAAAAAEAELTRRIEAGEFNGRDGTNVAVTSEFIAGEFEDLASPSRVILDAAFAPLGEDGKLLPAALPTHSHGITEVSGVSDTGRTFLGATTPAEARSAIGAGTSSLSLGTTSGTAMPGNKTFAKADVGLGNVDNTSDANKPVSTAQQAALDAKANKPDTRGIDAWFDALHGQETAGVSWVNLGSSTANGGNVSHVRYRWFERLAALMGPRLPLTLGAGQTSPTSGVQVYNGAAGGLNSSNYLTAAKVDQLVAVTPDLVTHMVGSNDWASNVAPETYKTNLRGWVNSIRARVSTVQILIHQQPRWDIAAPTYPWDAYRDAMRELAAEYSDGKVLFLDASKAFSPRGVVSADSWDLWDDDKIHLNDAGNRVLAEAVGGFLGLPSVASLPREVFTSGPTNGGSKTANEVYSTITIPARPYLRRVMVNSQVFAGLDAGTSGDINLILTAASSLDGVQKQQVSRVDAVRTATGNHLTAVIPPHTAGTTQLVYNPNGGTLYMTPTASYMSFTADVSPI